MNTLLSVLCRGRKRDREMLRETERQIYIMNERLRDRETERLRD